MILADKIIELRKKNGWSQEELAEKLHVSRQAVSKWEGAQSVPDLNKIISMADIFGVSTDYLLKEELETEQYVEKTYSESREGAEEKAVRWVSLEESNTFLEVNRKAAGKIAAGVMMCILSPILAVLLSCAGSVGYLSISEDQGGVIGAILIMIVIAGAVYDAATGEPGISFTEKTKVTVTGKSVGEGEYVIYVEEGEGLKAVEA